MNKLLLITGDLATGKTTFSRALSQRCGAAVFQKDAIKEILGDTVGFHNRAENKALSVATVAVMTHIFKQTAAFGVPLILEANFRTDELEKLQSIAAAAGCAVLTLVLRGDIDVLYGRYLHRMNDENRHPVHLSAPLHVREEFDAYIQALRLETVPGETIEIDASDFSYQTDEALLARIDRFMRPEAESAE